MSLRGSGGGYTGETGSVSVRVTDGGDPGLVVSPSSLTVVEGSTGSFTVKLATRPTAGVSVSVSSGDTGAVAVLPASLSFSTSNWNTAKTVTVSGVHDNDTVDERVTVSLRGSGGGYTGETGSVSVRVTDDDDPGLVVSPSSLTVDEGSTGSFTVKLATQPTAGVSVSVSSGDTGAVAVSSGLAEFQHLSTGALPRRLR